MEGLCVATTLPCCPHWGCQLIPWLTPARHKPWASSCGEMAEASPWIPCIPRCRGLYAWVRTTSWNPWDGQTCQFFPPWKTGRQCAPALRQCLLVELKPIHRHSLECFLSQSCFPMLLLCAGTHGCTKPPHLCKGSTGNCCLLGWLLSSCFSYDITVFKLQKRSISELKTWRFFHKSKREM